MSTSFLPSLPDLHFCESDPATVEAELFAAYEAATGRSLAPGNPERLFLATVAYEITMQRVIIDETARGQMLAYASGSALDHLGALVGTQRLAPAHAASTLRVDLAQALAVAWTAPAGTRVTPDGALIWTTDSALAIAAGETSGEVGITCATAGTVGNGYAPGQIARLVDPLASVASVANTSTSSGGADIEADDRYRERIHLAPSSFSVAGPEDAYRFWALSAHQDIVDVAVVSPAPVEIEIYTLLTGGLIPEADMLARIAAVLDRKDRVPLTDRISVLAPQPLAYDIELTWWLAQEDAATVSLVQQAVANAVAEYRLWQRSRLGRDIDPSELIRLVRSTGVKRVQVTSPAFTVVGQGQVAQEGTAQLTYGGLEAN